MKKRAAFLRGFSSAWKGMRLTLQHMTGAFRRRKNQDVSDSGYFHEKQGISTLLYPMEQLPVPDHGRYLLHNEIEDCIVCDKCAKICPVNCIEIEPIRSVTEFGKTSDGTSKRIYAARFDIDMAKCCFCGLCTTVCPTECLIMTPEYDKPVFDLGKLNFGFGNLSEEEAEAKRREWEDEKARKEAEKASSAASAPAAGRPARPVRALPSEPEKPLGSSPAADAPPPVHRPAQRPSAFPRPVKPKPPEDENP